MSSQISAAAVTSSEDSGGSSKDTFCLREGLPVIRFPRKACGKRSGREGDLSPGGNRPVERTNALFRGCGILFSPAANSREKAGRILQAVTLFLRGNGRTRRRRFDPVAARRRSEIGRASCRDRGVR